MSRSLIGCVAASLLLLTAVSAAAEDEPLPVPAEDLVFCTVCHGVQLMGNDLLKAPRLSGMAPWYIENQLQAFRKGWRGTHPEDLVGMEMQPMAAGLSDAQIERAAAFVGETRSPQPESMVEGDSQRGSRLYTSCAACHALDGSGNEALGAPALAGQNDWYMIHQLENYREGRRGYAAEDVYGQQMRASTGLLADDQAIRDVVAYIMTLPTN
ncbi:MAG: c-type cytochrome [Woeseiaceae bacterium]|nr:c-type cytochrome [Woeseiaceae bacterium]